MEANKDLEGRGFSANVNFEFDKWDLTDETKERLDRNAELLKSAPQFNLLIEGHTDSRGTNEYNLALGERRASVVLDYFLKRGVAEARLRYVSYGEERPLCTEMEESCWAQNRRAHMVITGRGA